MKLSVFGSSQIIYHHILAAQKNSFEINSICTSNKNSKNVFKLAKKFKIKKIFFDWKLFTKDCYLNKSSVLIAGKIGDNKKILSQCLKYKLKVLVEKPVFKEEKHFKHFLKFKKNIFVGYNRIYYENLNILKKNFPSKLLDNIIVKCPETSVNNIITNSCHIFSILYYLFGKIKILKKIKKKNSIFCIFITKKKIPIYIHINLNSPDNFSIELNSKNNIRAILNPIEQLLIFNKLIKKKYKKNNIYTPSISKKTNEYLLSKFKPGFVNQYYNFKKFIKNEKSNYLNIYDAKEIVSICNQIV